MGTYFIITIFKIVLIFHALMLFFFFLFISNLEFNPQFIHTVFDFSLYHFRN